eukprot:143352-Chlamydomonas_euryale.AAC.6
MDTTPQRHPLRREAVLPLGQLVRSSQPDCGAWGNEGFAGRCPHRGRALGMRPPAAAGVLLGVAAQPAAAATQSITQMQMKEAEELYAIIKQRSGTSLPSLTASPPAQARYGTARRGTPATTNACHVLNGPVPPCSTHANDTSIHGSRPANQLASQPSRVSQSSSVRARALAEATAVGSEADPRTVAELRAQLEKVTRELQVREDPHVGPHMAYAGCVVVHGGGAG